MACWIRNACVLLLTAWSAAASAQQPLVADLSSHLIAVTTGFVGQDLLLFGATDGEGDSDVVVVVRGPSTSLVVRRKERVGGIWVNRDEVTFDDLPAFYFVASSRPLDDIAEQAVLARQRIGIENLNFDDRETGHPDLMEFRAAAIRNLQREGLFGRQLGNVSFLGNQLFRTDVHFPSNVPTGAYLVTVYLIRDGAVESAQSTPLSVSKIGIGAWVYDFAYEQSALYGLLAIVLALLAGWLAGVVFRRP